jgi:eukaryotic-like serine/threonine-protein kinase
VLGTAGYLSPEQAQGERATPASDRYSLAVVAFELLSGRRPFEGESITAEAMAHVNAPVPSIAELCEGLPAELDAVFRRALAKDPARRFETASEFVSALRVALMEAAGATRSFAAAPPTVPTLSVLTPVSRRRARRWPLLVALLALAAVGGAIAAIVLPSSGHKSKSSAPPAPRTVTVTSPGSTAPSTESTPPPPPPPPPASSSLSGPALNDAGFAKMQAGDYTGALPLLQQAVAKLSGVGFPNEAYANYNLGYTLLQLGSCSEAIPYLKTAAHLEPQRHEPKDALKRARHC